MYQNLDKIHLQAISHIVNKRYDMAKDLLFKLADIHNINVNNRKSKNKNISFIKSFDDFILKEKGYNETITPLYNNILRKINSAK